VSHYSDKSKKNHLKQNYTRLSNQECVKK